MMRRLLGTLAGITLALGLVASPVEAQEVDEGSWAGTKLTTTSSSSGAAVTASIRWESNTELARADRFRVVLAMPDRAASQDDCPAPRFERTEEPPPEAGGAAPPTPSEDTVPATRSGNVYTATFSENLVTPCNGTYTLSATITRIRGDVPVGRPINVGTTATVANSAGTPRELSAERVDDGRVRLGWKAPEQRNPHDFLGYAVDRVDEDGTVTRLATGTTATGLTDTSADPDQALEYRVVTLREGPRGPGTKPIESDPATVGVAGPPAPEPSTTTTEADSAEVADAGSQGGGGVPDVRRPRTGTSRPRIGPAPSVTPTTIDTGFDESLPFDPDRMVGPRDAVVPEDEFASLIFDEPEGAGLAVPGATAAVLAVWAMHLHHLNRLARRDP